MDDSTATIQEMKEKIHAFVNERDWEKFHLPKDVAIALSIEVGEILEHFRFKSDKEIATLLKEPKAHEELSDELGDVCIFLVDLARVCNIDLSSAFEKKLEKSGKKYPKELVKGKNHKYTYYDQK